MASRYGVELAPIPGLSLPEAISINERSQRSDGIERIEEHGTVVFCSGSVQVMLEALGYDCPTLPTEAEERAVELVERLGEYAACYGVRW